MLPSTSFNLDTRTFIMPTIAIHELQPAATELTPEQAMAVHGGTDFSCMPPAQPWPMPEGWPFGGDFPMPSMPSVPQLPVADPPVHTCGSMAISPDPL
jgi:hypothetical protein